MIVGSSSFTTEEGAARLFEAWARSPSRFAEEALGIRPWGSLDDPSSQRAILDTVPYERRITVRSGHKTGKTTTAAILALWAYTLIPGVRVILTAPTFRQVQEVCWREVRRLFRTSKVPLGGRIYDSATAGLRGPDSREVFGMSTNEPDRFSGFSGAHVLYIVDEASGVDEAIFEAIEGNSAGGAWLILLGNPTRNTGTFYDSHTTSPTWRRFHLDSSRVAERYNPGGEIPGLARPDWCAERAQEWGKDSEQYRVRVEGSFPSQESDAIVSLDAVNAAQLRWTKIQPRDVQRYDWRLVCGVDVARFGDDESVIQSLRGPYAFPVQVERNLDGPSLAARVLAHVKHFRLTGEGKVPGSRVPLIVVDEIGEGASCYDALVHARRARLTDCEIMPIRGSWRADDSHRYRNLRTQILFGSAAWLRDVGAIPPDQQLASDLLATRYAYDDRSRYAAEDKRDVKQRLGRSPDRADALAFAVYGATPAFEERMRAFHLAL